LGVTGSGKTFTVANVIAAAKRPTIIMAHNKTLAAQLYGEFKEFFPNNAVEYFVSYYDYYQPEAYVAASDTFIEKDASVNEHIEQMRLSATKALLERRDELKGRLDALINVRGVKVHLCDKTRKEVGLDKAKVYKGIDLTASGVAKIAMLQSEGFAYLKIQ